MVSGSMMISRTRCELEVTGQRTKAPKLNPLAQVENEFFHFIQTLAEVLQRAVDVRLQLSYGSR